MAAITHPIDEGRRQSEVTRVITALVAAIAILVGLAALTDGVSQPDWAPVVEMTPTGTTVPSTAVSISAVDP